MTFFLSCLIIMLLFMEKHHFLFLLHYIWLFWQRFWCWDDSFCGCSEVLCRIHHFLVSGFIWLVIIQRRLLFDRSVCCILMGLFVQKFFFRILRIFHLENVFYWSLKDWLICQNLFVFLAIKGLFSEIKVFPTIILICIGLCVSIGWFG